MTVYTLSAAGLSTNTLSSANQALQWVKLFPADTGDEHWLVQTFPANLVGTSDNSANDQSTSYVYFAQGSQPAQSAANSTNVNALTYDVAVPVGSSVELNPTVDWWVAYPVHGSPFAPGGGNLTLKANQVVTIVASRHAGSLYDSSVTTPTGDSLSSPAGGALMAWADPITIPSSAYTPMTWNLSDPSQQFLYAVGGLALASYPKTLVPGVYEIDVNMRWFPNTTGSRYLAIVFCPVANIGSLNVTSAPKFAQISTASNVPNGTMQPISIRCYLPANTYIIPVVYQDSGAGLGISGDGSTINVKQVG